MRPTALPLFALLFASPALAQPGPGAPSQPVAPRTEAPSRDLAGNVEDPLTLARLAASALDAGRAGDATELLERAESRLLTRGELASEADRPAVGGVVGELAAARDAIARRDRAGATTLIQSALGRMERGEPPALVGLPMPGLEAATGATTAPTPAAGGGRAAIGIAPSDMATGGHASPAMPMGPATGPTKPPPHPAAIPPASTKAPL